MGAKASRVQAAADAVLPSAAPPSAAAPEGGAAALRADGAAEAPPTPQQLPAPAATEPAPGLGHARPPPGSPEAAAEAAYIARVVQRLRATPGGRDTLAQLGQDCRLPPALKTYGALRILRAHADELEVVADGVHSVRVLGAPAADAAGAPSAPPPPPPPVPLPTPAALPKPLDAQEVALRKEEAVLVETMVAYFRGKAATQLPINSVAGACQLTPRLRRTYGTLREFVSASGSVLARSRFSLDGAQLELLKAPASAAALAAAEAAYVARVVQLLRHEQGAQLPLPALGERCRLPAGLKSRGCFSILLAHADKLEVVRPLPRGDHFVRLAQRPAASPAEPGMRDAFSMRELDVFDNPLGSRTYYVRSAQAGGSAATTPPPPPPPCAAAGSAAVAVEAAFLTEVIQRLRTVGVRGTGGQRSLALELVAPDMKVSLWRSVKPRYGTLRAFLEAHADVFVTTTTRVTLRAAGAAQPPPAAPAAPVAVAPPPPPPPPLPPPPPSPPLACALDAEVAIEAAFVAEVVARLRTGGRLALEHVAPGTASMWQSLKPRYGKLRRFLDAHTDVFSTTTTHVTLRAAGASPLPAAPPAAAAAPPAPPAAAAAAPPAPVEQPPPPQAQPTQAAPPPPQARPQAPQAPQAQAVAYAAAVAARLATKRTMLLSALGEALPMPTAVRLQYTGLRACLAAFPELFIVTSTSVQLVRAAGPRAAASGRSPSPPPPPRASARPRTPPPRQLVAFEPPKKQARRAPSMAFEVPLPWSANGLPATLAVRMPRREGVADALAWLTVDDPVAPPPLARGVPVRLLGVDVETDAVCETAMVQLSTATRCVLIRWRGLAALGAGRAGFDALCALLADDSWLKVGCELRKDAIDLLHDSGCAARMRGGRDVTPALARSGPAGARGAVYGLVEAFNMRHGTALVKSKEVQCSDWDAAALSQEQLAYAALDAWLSFRVGAADGGSLLHHADTRASTSRARRSGCPARSPLQAACCASAAWPRTRARCQARAASATACGRRTARCSSRWRSTTASCTWRTAWRWRLPASSCRGWHSPRGSRAAPRCSRRTRAPATRSWSWAPRSRRWSASRWCAPRTCCRRLSTRRCWTWRRRGGRWVLPQRTCWTAPPRRRRRTGRRCRRCRPAWRCRGR
jgi:hypothetical protein